MTENNPKTTAEKQMCSDSTVAPCYVSCIKCGGEDIYRRFYKKEQDTNPVPRPKVGLDSTAFVNRSSDWVQPAIKDCIVHHCRCCGYTWDGETLAR